MKHGAVLGQEFFDQSQFRRWWYSLNMYSCFLGAKNIDVVLDETDYKWKFNQNEEWPLGEFVKQGKAQIIYRDPQGTLHRLRRPRRQEAGRPHLRLRLLTSTTVQLFRRSPTMNVEAPVLQTGRSGDGRPLEERYHAFVYQVRQDRRD